MAAKGAWIDILCAMWRSQIRGRLSLSWVGYSRLIGATVDQTKAVISELVDLGVCDCEIDDLPVSVLQNTPCNGHVTEGVTERVTLVSRRMVRDEEDRENNRLRVSRHRKKQGKQAGNGECNAGCNAACNGDVTVPLSYSSSSSGNTSVLPSISLVPQEGGADRAVSPEATKRKQAKDSVPYEEIVSLYHEILPELPRVKLLTDKRKAWIKTRWNEDPQRQDLQWWREYFESVRDQAHLMGDNDRGWKADLEFLVKADKMARVLEKSYQRENKNGNHNGNEQAVLSWLNRKKA